MLHDRIQIDDEPTTTNCRRSIPCGRTIVATATVFVVIGLLISGLIIMAQHNTEHQHHNKNH